MNKELLVESFVSVERNVTSCNGGTGNSLIIGGSTISTELTVYAKIYIEIFIFYDVCYDIKNKNQTEGKRGEDYENGLKRGIINCEKPISKLLSSNLKHCKLH